MVRTRFGLLLCALTAALSSSARAEGEPGLVLETGSPDALCPELSQAREAVSRRLGALEVTGRRGFRARYTVGHAPEGSPRDFVRLELFDSEGARELVRDLPMSGESCSTMAEAIALVLERHFRGISPEESASGVEERGQPSAPRPPVRGERVVTTPPLAARPPAPRASLVPPFGALLLAEFALSPSRPAALGVRALAPLGEHLLLGGALLFDLGYEREELPLGGRARALGGELRASLAWRVGNAPWFGYLGPSLSLGLQQGETRNVPEHSNQLRALWAGGFEAGAGWRISRHLALGLSGALMATVLPLSGRFYVSGQEVLRPSVPQFRAGLGAGYAF